MPEPGTHPVHGDHFRQPVWIEIRKVLMLYWDPIGVKDDPLTADEYESSIPKIMALLRADATVDALMDYLADIESKRMGFTFNRDFSRVASEHLLPLKSLLKPI